MFRRVLVLAALAAVVATPVAASEHKFKVFAAAGFVAPLSDDDLTIEGVTDAVEASSEFGYDFGIEWRPTRLIGIELDYLDAKHDVEFGGAKIAEVDLQPLTASLNFHLIHTNLIDFYVGANLAYVSWGDIEVVDGSKIGTDSETAFGATVGVDIGIGSRLALVGSVRYLKVDVTPDGEDGLSVDPLITRVGVALRF